MFAQGGYESGGVGDGAADDFSNWFTAAFRKGGSAIRGKTVDIEHRGSPDHQLVEHDLRLMAPSSGQTQDVACLALDLTSVLKSACLVGISTVRSHSSASLNSSALRLAGH